MKKILRLSLLLMQSLSLCAQQEDAPLANETSLKQTSLQIKTFDSLVKIMSDWPEGVLINFFHSKKQLPLTFDEFYTMTSICLYECQKKVPLPYENQFIVQKVSLTSSTANICIIGDIHGSWHALMKILNDLINPQHGKQKYIDNNFKIINPNFYMIFTGDYIDRGNYGLEVLYTLMCLKLNNWDNVFLLKGNHEDIKTSMLTRNNFYNELLNKFPGKSNDTIKEYVDSILFNPSTQTDGLLSKWFKLLPQALYLRTQQGEWIQFCHGGMHEFTPQTNNIDPTHFLQSQDQMRLITAKDFETIDTVSKTKIVENGVRKTGFLWDDLLYQENKFVLDAFARTGTRHHDPIDVSKNGLASLGLKAIFRGHQHFGSGLKMISSSAFFGCNNPAINKDEPTALPGFPVAWNKVVSEDERKKGAINICQAECPVFTFTTATELNAIKGANSAFEVFYGLLKISPMYEDWVLIPVSIENKRTE